MTTAAASIPVSSKSRAPSASHTAAALASVGGSSSSSSSSSSNSPTSLPPSRSASRSSLGSNTTIGSRSAVQTNKISRTSVGTSAPLGTITNRNGVASSYDDAAYRKMSSSSIRRSRDEDAMPPPSLHDGDRSSDRVRGPRSSVGTNRSVSHRVPSALRRLPPGGSRVASRTILPSGNHPSSSSSTSSFAHEASASSSAHPSSSSSRPGVAALARANGRRSLGATLNAAANGGAAQHDRDGREINKLTVDSTSFEEWMKMATDNKINATNTWNFALIDYFHDMSLLRSDNGDGSINFQKASCTLDGCVKVWTSRVDSVVVETGKLLSGLQDDGKDGNAKNGRGRNADDDEDGEDAGDDDETGPRKKRSRAREPTLAKSFNQLAVKKLDLEFTVDPLFKKTSADFDEGGAGGLLMNHLGVDSSARVVFDASDVPGQDDAEDEATAPPVTVDDGSDRDSDGLDEDDEDGDVTEIGRRRQRTPRGEDLVDLTKLRSKLFGQHDYATAGEEDALGALLGSMTVCPTFASFRFAPDDKTSFSSLMADGVSEQSPAPFSTAGSVAMSQDWDDDMNDLPAFDDGMDDAFGNVGGGNPSGGLFGTGGDGFEYQDGEFDGGGLVDELDAGTMDERGTAQRPMEHLASLQGLLEGSDHQMLDGDDFFGYFDQKMSKNWAGPEHWKMRKTIAAAPRASDGAQGAEKSTRKVKEPFVIDFTSAEGAVMSKELFETARVQTGTMMPATKQNDELYLLPEDRHFSSRQLLRLFIKPRAMLNPRRQGQMLDGRVIPRNDADADFWVQAAALSSGGGAGNALGFDADEDDGMPSMPFDTQFFHEDDGGFDPMDEAAEHPLALEAEDEEELATQALKRIRPEFVNYAKKAKRVDVRKLKENIWRELAMVVGEEGEEEEEDDEDVSGDGPRTPKTSGAHEGMDLDRVAATMGKRDPTDPRTFEAVLAGLRKLYPKDRMDEISTSFCFICLLHLANEEGLRIRTAPDGIGGLGMLAGRAIVEDEEEEEGEREEEDGVLRRASAGRRSKSVSRGNGEAEEDDDPDRGRVGFLEYLSIAKDPTAGRSA